MNDTMYAFKKKGVRATYFGEYEYVKNLCRTTYLLGSGRNEVRLPLKDAKEPDLISTREQACSRKAFNLKKSCSEYFRQFVIIANTS